MLHIGRAADQSTLLSPSCNFIHGATFVHWEGVANGGPLTDGAMESWFITLIHVLMLFLGYCNLKEIRIPCTASGGQLIASLVTQRFTVQ